MRKSTLIISSIFLCFMMSYGQQKYVDGQPFHVMKVPNGTITVDGNISESVYSGLNGWGAITIDPVCCDASASGNSAAGSTLKNWLFYDDDNLYFSSIFIDDVHYNANGLNQRTYYNDDVIEFYLYPPDYGDICAGGACNNYVRMFKRMENDGSIFIMGHGEWPCPLFTVVSVPGFDWKVSSADGLIWQSEMKIAWFNQYINHSSAPTAGIGAETWGIGFNMNDNDGAGLAQFPTGGKYLNASFGLATATFCDPSTTPGCGADTYHDVGTKILSRAISMLRGNSIMVNPNPFMTSAKVILPEKSMVSVYNSRGEKVRNLMSNNGSLVWRGDDSRGRALESGIYLLKANADDKLMTKRVTIVR